MELDSCSPAGTRCCSKRDELVGRGNSPPIPRGQPSRSLRRRSIPNLKSLAPTARAPRTRRSGSCSHGVSKRRDGGTARRDLPSNEAGHARGGLAGSPRRIRTGRASRRTKAPPRPRQNRGPAGPEHRQARLRTVRPTAMADVEDGATAIERAREVAPGRESRFVLKDLRHPQERAHVAPSDVARNHRARPRLGFRVLGDLPPGEAHPGDPELSVRGEPERVDARE